MFQATEGYSYKGELDLALRNHSKFNYCSNIDNIKHHGF